MATPSNQAGYYKFHLILKGLFRCVPDRKNNRLSVLLVDARSGKTSKVTREPLRDHRAVLEFRLKDWRNRKRALPGFVEVKKANKGRMGLLLLEQQDIRIRARNGELSPGLKFIEDESPNDFRRLPQLKKIAPSTAPVLEDALRVGLNCIARVLDLDRGEVRSERASTRGGQPLKWAFSHPRPSRKLQNLSGLARVDRKQLEQDLKTAKEINLDVRITTQVPNGASVVLDVNPFTKGASDLPAFLLRPKNGEDLEVWIKNRELEVILTESDEIGGEESCPLAGLTDSDFELHYELSAKADKAERKVPYRDVFFKNGEVTAGGCACGGCTGG